MFKTHYLIQAKFSRTGIKVSQVKIGDENLYAMY